MEALFKPYFSDLCISEKIPFIKAISAIAAISGKKNPHMEAITFQTECKRLNKVTCTVWV